MKRIIMFVLLFAALKVAGQTTGYLRFDTVKIMKQNGTCELFIINKTKDSLGLLTNVGGGLTRFIKPKMLNDSSMVIGLDTIVIHGASGGQNLSNASLTANGDYTHNWAQHPLKIDSIADTLRLSMFHPWVNQPLNKYRFNLNGYNSSVYQFALEWGLTDISGTGGDSAYAGITSSSLGTSIAQFRDYGSKYASIELNGGFNAPYVAIGTNDYGAHSNIIMDRSIYLSPKDSLSIKAVAAATADSALGIRKTRDFSGQEVSTVVKFPVPTPAGGSATLSNAGSGYRLVKTADGQVKTTFAGYGILKDSSSNTDGITDKADTSTLKAVYLPLNLNAAKTINQATNNITFAGGGKVRADSFSIKKTITPFITGDSLVGFGHSIMAGSSATVTDSNFLSRIGRFRSLFVSNRGVPSSMIWSAVKIQMAWINAGHNAYTAYMPALNDVRTTNILSAGNRKTINSIVNGMKAMWMNHMAKTATGAGDGSITRSGSWNSSWDASVEAGKKTNAAYTSSGGAYAEYSFTDSTVGVQFMGNSTGGATVVTIAIDGSTVETFNLNSQHDGNSGSYMPTAKFFTGLTNTSHTLRVTNTSGDGLMIVDYFTNLRDAASAPPIVFFHEPYLDATGYSGGQASDAAIDTINVKYDSLRNSLPSPWKARTIVARTNTRYVASTSSGLSGDHVHPNDLGHYQISLAERDAVNAIIGADSGTVQYGTDGFLYVDAKKIPYTNTLGLNDVINNNPVMSTPADIRGSIFEFNGFTRIGLNFFKIGSTSQGALAHGTLGVQGPLGGLFIGSRTSDTTKGFIFYADAGKAFVYDTYNSRTNIHIDSSMRAAFFNNTVTSTFTTPSATIHIGGNTNGVAGHTPFKMGKSVWVTTPEAYAWETDSLYIGWTNGGGLRDTLATRGWARANLTGSSGITSINSKTGPGITLAAGVGTLVNNAVSNQVSYDVDPTSSIFTRVIDVQYADANNSGTSVTDLYSKSVAGGTLGDNGSSLEFQVAGTLNDGTASSDLQVTFGGNSIGGTGAITVTGPWSARGTIIRVSSSTVRTIVVFTVDNATAKVFSTTSNTAGMDLTTTNILKITGQAGGGGGGSNDITGQLWKVIYQPAP